MGLYRQLKQPKAALEVDPALRRPSAEGQKAARGNDGRTYAMLGEEQMADDLGLLLDAIANERLVILEPVIIAAKWVAEQRQIEAAELLSLPDMGHFVNEMGLRR